MNTECEKLPMRAAADIDPVSDQEHIIVSDTFITIVTEYPYHLELASMNTPEKLLGVVMHLTEKTWMTPIMLRGFIRTVCRLNNIKIVY